MSLKSKKKPPKSTINKNDLETFIVNDDTLKNQPLGSATDLNSKSIRTQSSSSSSSSKMNKQNQNKQQQQQQQQRKVSTEITVNQRIREFFELFRCRFTIRSSNNRRHSKQSIKSNDKKRNSSLISNSNVNNVDKIEQQQQQQQQKAENNSTTNLTATSLNENENENLKQCRLCCNEYEINLFYDLSCCTHKFCINCLQTYLNYQITESRITITCPQCTEKLHPIDIYKLLENYNLKLIEKYEEFMLRRVLVTITDVRFCPAPDCNYAVIANGCANCPELKCLRPGCNTSFCYHCKQYWHPNITCEDAALIHRNATAASIINLNRSNSHISLISSFQINGGTSSSNNIKDEMKRCPKCQAPIVKMDDGSCNHITCAVCGCEFCWLCMKEISDLHYLSPSGCTFWGKKPWSRKKKILWQLGTLIGAPIGIALLAGVAVPAILIGLPIWSGRKVYLKFKSSNKHKRNIIVVSTVFGTILISPVVAALTVGIGVPILLAYVYGVVPISLCRSSGGCGVTTNPNGVRFAFDDEDNFTINQNSTQTNPNTATNINRASILKTSNKKSTNITNSTTTTTQTQHDLDENSKIESQVLVTPNESPLNINNIILPIPSAVTNTTSSNLKSNKTNKNSTTKNYSFRIKKLSKTQTNNSINSMQSSSKQLLNQQSDIQSVNINNPSLAGCESIGAYTTSLSASGSNIDRINDVNYVDDENDEVDVDDDVDVEEEIDRDSASNRALAGSTKSKKYKISFDDNPIIVEQQQHHKQEAEEQEEQIYSKQNDIKSYDSFSITISEKSANPSVIALAGSIKDNQSLDSQSNDDINHIKRKTSVVSNNSEQQQHQQQNNIPTSDHALIINSKLSNKNSKKKFLSTKLI